jgi:hypothetical protein
MRGSLLSDDVGLHVQIRKEVFQGYASAHEEAELQKAALALNSTGICHIYLYTAA